MAAPESIARLVARFRQNISSYKSGFYNETQVRREFIDPFFEALGWDVINRQGYAEPYKDVVHEDAIRVGNTTKAPDYCFRIGGTRKFFVEAKKPTVNVRMDVHPAYQLRRYAWSAKLPISILTNFEEFAVYDCRSRPKPTDKASTDRILLLRFEDYEDQWDKIAEIFSKQAILEGAFDQFQRDVKVKRGTEAVDEAFLKELDGWRNELARNIALRNSNISVRELNESVQLIIDRIVFLRICEDRGIEDYGRLRKVAEGNDAYRALLALFAQADDKYNSGLFYLKPEANRPSRLDKLTPKLRIDDRVIKQILRHLYYPESPYEFSVLGADILGKVYEEFLGKTITLSASGRAKVEEKPEVRKAGGVYYTPQHVVEHLVERTVGVLLEGASPDNVKRIRILDPACGSGSFLLVAYQRLLDWHLDWYVRDDAEKHARGRRPVLFRGSRGQWHLTVATRKAILTNNIFGVDIDPQAVEVSKLSLLLKVLEGEVEALPNLKLFQERALPDLGKNILCGNSLVGFDFVRGLSVSVLSRASNEVDAINSFDWEKAFPDVFANGGFDVVLGNPPYLSYAGRQRVDIPEPLRKYFDAVYECAGWPTSHSFFVERAVSKLSRRFVAFIVPDQVGHLDGYRSVRSVVGSNTKLAQVRYWGEKVFRGVTTPALTFVADTKWSGDTEIIELNGTTCRGILKPGDPWFLSASKELLETLRPNSFSARSLLADCGIRTTAAKQQVVAAADARPVDLLALEGKRIGRFWCSPPTIAVRRDRGKVICSAEEKYAAAQFLVRQTAAYPIVGPRRHVLHFRNSLHALMKPEPPMDVRYVVGLLNSRLMRFAYVTETREAGQKAFPQVKLGALAKLPLRRIDFGAPEEKRIHDEIVELVQALLDLHDEWARLRDPEAHTGLRRRIEALDHRLDEAVFGLYGLDEVGRQIVDKSLLDSPSPPNFPESADRTAPFKAPSKAGAQRRVRSKTG